MSLWQHGAYAGHQRVTFVRDEISGLLAIQAMHRLVDGRCGGGIRFYPYVDESEALTDVLRLSQAMTYKMMLAGLRLGGGKTVVIGNPAADKSRARLLALGRYVDSLQGQYLAGPDVGTNPDDMATMREMTPYVAGHAGLNTAAPTAYGVFRGIQAAVRYQLGAESLAGLTVAVQGTGGVGERLCQLLHEAGAALIVADVQQTAVARVALQSGAQIVTPDAILSVKADVLAPCALGAVLNDETIPTLRTTIICGGANNQLAEPRHGVQLSERGILFAPDYVVNAGGVIGGVAQLGLLDEAERASKLEQIYSTTLEIFERARRDQTTPEQAAVTLAEARLATFLTKRS